MEWLQNLLNAEDNLAIQLVLITLLLMIGLILIVWIFRRIAGSPSRRAARNRIPRLSITDSAAVDDKRYLVLVRRDNVEHLVLIGGPTDVVVESNIVRVQPAAQPSTRSEKPPLAATKPEPEEMDKPAPAQTVAQPEDEPRQEPAAVPAAASVAAAATVATAVTMDEPEEQATVEAEAIEENIEIASQSADFEDTGSPEEQIEEQVTFEPEPPVEIAEAPEVFEPVQDLAPEPVAEPEPEIVAEHIEQEPEIVQEPVSSPAVEPEAPAETILEDEISKQLDDALSAETFSVDLDPEPTMEPEQVVEAESVEPVKSGPDDEMQRLLDELASESKEPA